MLNPYKMGLSLSLRGRNECTNEVAHVERGDSSIQTVYKPAERSINP